MNLNFRCLLPAVAAGLLSFPAAAQNVERGKEINGTCAACHGELGQGGKKGEYPRIAGLRAVYIEDQLRAYRARKRINIPMFPYTQERELPDEDIRDLAAYLSTIKLSSTMPTFKGDEDALTRLIAVDKVMIIARVEGDIANGGEVYQKDCASCHGKKAKGIGGVPMLVGQYTNYLKKQMDTYIKGERPHEDGADKDILAKLTEKDLQDILAYLTSIQEQE